MADNQNFVGGVVTPAKLGLVGVLGVVLVVALVIQFSGSSAPALTPRRGLAPETKENTVVANEGSSRPAESQETARQTGNRSTIGCLRTNDSSLN